MISNVTRSYERSIRREDILLSDADLLKRYMGIDKIPCSIRSPLRNDDKYPSFSFFIKNGKIYWKDFGTGDGGDVMKFFMRAWNLDYQATLERISTDTGYKVCAPELEVKIKGKVRYGSGADIKIRTREWKQWDTDYWKQFGISKEMCRKCQVYPISTAFFIKKTGNETTILSTPMDRIAYAYLEWKDGKESIKLYQPYSKRMKWLSNRDSSVWDLWKQAMKWNDKSILIITSSRKDAMCLWENLNVPSICMQGEGYLPKPQVMEELKSKFNRIYLWYDNDFGREDGRNPGQDDAARLVGLYPWLVNICNPERFGCKDPSDLVKEWGTEFLKEIWNGRT